MKMASPNYSVFTAFTILTLSLALCSASRTTLFSKDVGEIEGDDHQVSLDHVVRPPPRRFGNDEVEADKFGFKVRDGGYEPEKKRKQGDYDVEAAKMSNMDHKVSAFTAKDERYEPEGKRKHGEYDVEAAKMSNMDHADMIMGHGRVRPISGYRHRNDGDMMGHYRVRQIRGSSNDGDMNHIIMGHGQVRPISGNSIDGVMKMGHGWVRPISGYRPTNDGGMITGHGRVRPMSGYSNDGGMIMSHDRIRGKNNGYGSRSQDGFCENCFYPHPNEPRGAAPDPRLGSIEGGGGYYGGTGGGGAQIPGVGAGGGGGEMPGVGEGGYYGVGAGGEIPGGGGYYGGGVVGVFPGGGYDGGRAGGVIPGVGGGVAGWGSIPEKGN